jgi:hypothetical protein
MASFARIYQRSFDSHPAATLALAGGSLSAFGDMVAQATQLVFAKRNHDPPVRYDPRRTLRFFVFGFGMSMFYFIFLRMYAASSSINIGLARRQVLLLGAGISCSREDSHCVNPEVLQEHQFNSLHLQNAWLQTSSSCECHCSLLLYRVSLMGMCFQGPYRSKNYFNVLSIS